jgi:hypothetical protein
MRPQLYFSAALICAWAYHRPFRCRYCDRSDGTASSCLPIQTNQAAVSCACSQGHIDSTCAISLPAGVDTFISYFLKALVAWQRGDKGAAKAAEFACLDQFLTLFQSPDALWMLPALRTLCRDSYVVANSLRSGSGLMGRSGAANEAMVRPQLCGGSVIIAWLCVTYSPADDVTCLQESLAALLQKAFKVTSQDRAAAEVSKKWGTLFVVNSLFRLYFRVSAVLAS